jgi:hypothetical protein
MIPVSFDMTSICEAKTMPTDSGEVVSLLR